MLEPADGDAVTGLDRGAEREQRTLRVIRVGAASRTTVRPSASRPALARALHLSARRRRRGLDASRRPPTTETGACPSLVSITAPMARSGPAARSIGRPLRLASPVSTVRNGAEDTTPISSRIVVRGVAAAEYVGRLDQPGHAPHPRRQVPW